MPERCRLEHEFAGVGLNELVEDLHTRQVSVPQIRGEVQLAWWTTVFEDIVRSSAIISNQDGSALQTASDRFAQIDVRIDFSAHDQRAFSQAALVNDEVLDRLLHVVDFDLLEQIGRASCRERV